MITDNYREIPDIPFGDMPVIHYMWHTSHYPSILTHWHHEMVYAEMTKTGRSIGFITAASTVSTQCHL